MSDDPVADLDARHAAAERGVPFLVYRDADGAQRIVSLDPAGGALTIGRREEADIRLPWDGEVSRLHAELTPRAGEWTIADDGLSQNGTFVNELAVEGKRRLRDGDLVRVGRTVLEFCAGGPPVGSVTVAPGKATSQLTFSELQQRLLAAFCRPLREGAGEPASDAAIAAAIGESPELVAAEITHLIETLGLAEVAEDLRRYELAILALRAGLVSADD